MSELTFKEVEEICLLISNQRAAIDEVAAKKRELDQKLDELEAKLVELLHALNRTSYPSAIGTFSISHRLSVKNPEGPENKKAFFDYLKEKGLFENMATIHSATLNSFYKAEFEAAKERGEGVDFELPGINAPTVNEIISFRAAKK